MSIIMFKIPEDTAKWPNWLEQRMVGLDLADLVAELTCALKDQPAKSKSLDDVCGGQMPQLLKHGFSKLSTIQIRQLFKQPDLLLELQERVLTEGGLYWDKVKLPAEEQAVIDTSTKRTLEKLKEKLPHRELKPTTGEIVSSRVWGALAIAAALLIAVGIWRNLPSSSSGGWGFEKEGLLTANVSAAKYLSSLADAAGQWSNKRPATTVALETRLKEFRRGCDALIQAPHNQLAQADRQWLVGKCKEWAAKIDGYILELQNGSGTLEQVQKQADETINRLQQALRDRALQTA